MSVNLFYATGIVNDGYARETDDDCSGGAATVIWDDWPIGPFIRASNNFGAVPYYIRRGYFYPNLTGFSIPVGQYVSRVRLYLYCSATLSVEPTFIYSLAQPKSHWATVQDHFTALGAGTLLATDTFALNQGRLIDLGSAGCAYITAHPTFAGFAVLADEANLPTDDKRFHDSEARDGGGLPFEIPYLEVTLSPLASSNFFFAAKNYPAGEVRG